MVRAYAAGGDFGHGVVFSLDGEAGEAAEHRQLADVSQRIGDGALEEFFYGGVERLFGGKVVIEGFKGGEEAVHFPVPFEGLGVVPGFCAAGNGKRPVVEVAHVGEDLSGGA